VAPEAFLRTHSLKEKRYPIANPNTIVSLRHPGLLRMENEGREKLLYRLGVGSGGPSFLGEGEESGQHTRLQGRKDPTRDILAVGGIHSGPPRAPPPSDVCLRSRGKKSSFLSHL